MEKIIKIFIPVLFAIVIIWICGRTCGSNQNDSIQNESEYTEDSGNANKEKQTQESLIYIDEQGNFNNILKEEEDNFLTMHPGARIATEEEILKEEKRKLESADIYIDNKLTTGNSPYNDFFGEGYYDESSLCEITVINGSEQDAIVIFQDIKSNKVIRNIYISAADNFTVKKIPEGTYDMKCSFGNGWNPILDNGSDNPVGGFVQDVSFSKTASSKDYFYMKKEKTKSGYNYSTYTVTLHKVIDGNMQTKDISKNDFFN